MRYIVFIAAIALCSACVTPGAENAAGARPAQLASTDGEQKICKNVPVTGSNMPRRVCSTRAEWDAYAKKGREGVEQFDNDMRSQTTAGAIDGH
jgi:hypothetical protein